MTPASDVESPTTTTPTLPDSARNVHLSVARRTGEAWTMAPSVPAGTPGGESMESEEGLFRTLVSVKSSRQFDWQNYPLTRVVTDGTRFVGLIARSNYPGGLLGLVDDAGWEHLDQSRYVTNDLPTLCLAPRNWVVLS